jgi:hypothetical protein
MELRAAPRVLRFIFEGWVVAACAMLVAIYWLSPAAPQPEREHGGGRQVLGGMPGSSL